MNYDGDNKAIDLATRDGDSPGNYRSLDGKSAFGSGKYDWDHVRYNVVAQNQFVNRNPPDLIHAGKAGAALCGSSSFDRA